MKVMMVEEAVDFKVTKQRLDDPGFGVYRLKGDFFLLSKYAKVAG